MISQAACTTAAITTAILFKGLNMLAYPYVITPDDNGTFLLTFPDVPEAVAVGEDVETAQIEALDGLLCALDGYFADRRAIPLPSDMGAAVIVLPALVTAKILLSNEMLAQGVKKAEMARRLGVHMPQIDRLLDLRHSTKLEFVEQATAQLGKRLDVALL